MLLSLLAVLAPVFLCILAGWIWARLGRQFDTRQAAQLVMDVGSPCLILATIPGLPIDGKAVLEFSGACITAIGLTAALAFLLLRTLGWPWRDFLAPLVFGNHGNMGLSLSLFAFGEQGLALSLVFFTISTLLHFTVGIGTLDREFSVGRTARSPLVLAMAAALLLLGTHHTLPGWLHQTFALLGNIAIPLMLLALGVALATIGSGEPRAGLALTMLRLLTGLGGGWLAALVFGLDGTVRNVLLLQAAMPAAVFSYLLAEQYRRSPAAVAGYVIVSTVLSIPLLLVLLWSLQST